MLAVELAPDGGRGEGGEDGIGVAAGQPPHLLSGQPPQLGPTDTAQVLEGGIGEASEKGSPGMGRHGPDEVIEARLPARGPGDVGDDDHGDQMHAGNASGGDGPAGLEPGRAAGRPVTGPGGGLGVRAG